MAELTVWASPVPFSNKNEQVTVPQGSTVQDIVDAVFKPKYEAAGASAIVFINGTIIPMNWWPQVRPKENTIVNVRVIPTGGGGKKNPIASLLSIAVMVAAPYAATGLLGNTLFTTAGMAKFALAATTGAIGLVGRMLVSAVAPPPKPSNMGNVSNPAESPTQFIEGASNSINPFGVVPICLGTNRMFPFKAARDYTETIDNDQFVRSLFTFGFGDKIQIANERIGETAITEYSSIDMEYRLNGDLHAGTTIYTNDVYQENYNVLLEETTGFVVRTTQPNIDEAILDVTFPRGLAAYNANGYRGPFRVQLEVQYAPTGTSDWSTPLTDYRDIPGNTITIDRAEYVGREIVSGVVYRVAYRKDMIVIDEFTGDISLVMGTSSAETAAQAMVPNLPAGKIRLGSVTVRTRRPQEEGAETTVIMAVTDDRQSSLFGTIFETSMDFAVTGVGTTVTVDDGGLKMNAMDYTEAQNEALRKSVRMKFPSVGTYDVRIRRITPDNDSDQVFDEVYLTALKSVKYQAPVKLQGINGAAMLAKGTDQLNGPIDQYNADVSLVCLDYNEESDEWFEAITSNPASLYRYVLQCAANSKALPDSKIDLDDIQDWHAYCRERGYTYNRIIDYETSLDEVLRDIAAAGAASPAIVDGKRTIVIDRVQESPVQVITPRNSWDFSGEVVYPDLPHAFRVQFRNKLKGYQQDERIVYADGYDESNATLFELLDFQSCTDSDLAFKHARRLLAVGYLRRENFTVKMDVEHISFLRGQRVLIAHDIPIVGVGDGRIKEIFYSGDSPNTVTGFALDDTVGIPNDSTYYVRIRLSDGSLLYKELVTTIGNETQFNFAVPFSVADSPAVGDLCYVVEAGGELDAIVTRIEPDDDLAATITLTYYAQPEITNAESAPIPAFNSFITTPLDLIRPVKPQLVNEQSDEGVMIRGSDGKVLSRAVFTLRNDNQGEIFTTVKVREAGTGTFGPANILEATPERVILTGLQDGKRYDIHIRYGRSGGSLISPPLELNNYLYIGASGTPSDVTGFKITRNGPQALLGWDASTDIDHSHYTIRFSNSYSGATWGTAQILEQKVYETRLVTPFLGGTYLIKAVDFLGNESANATAIITYNPNSIINVVANIEEDPDFDGTTDNVNVFDGTLLLDDTDLIDGYYYFDGINLGGLFTSYVTASILANGAIVNNLFDYDDMFAIIDLFGGGANDLLSETDLFALEDLFGIGADAWAVALEYSAILSSPSDSPAAWGDWLPLQAGNIEFWAIKFRLKMTSLATNVSPQVTQLSVMIDMPDRIERGDDLALPETGATITYDGKFMANPALNITIQDGDANDELQYSSKTASGFTVQVYNTTLMGYVNRTFDFIASGYGRDTAV